MEKRNLKFALITRIMSAGQVQYPLQFIKHLLREFKHEIGLILSIHHEGTKTLNEVLDQERFELKFEKMTFDVEVVRNRQTRSSTIKNFIMN